MTKRRKRILTIAPLAVIGMILFLALGGEIVALLWNWLLPTLFGLPQVTFWQALGLLALCRILFGGLGVHGPARSGIRRRMAERWEHMSPEDRERMREHMRERWGFGPAAGETKGTE